MNLQKNASKALDLNKKRREKTEIKRKEVRIFLLPRDLI